MSGVVGIERSSFRAALDYPIIALFLLTRNEDWLLSPTSFNLGDSCGQRF